MRHEYSYSDIVEMLKDHAEDIAFDCLAGAKRIGPRIYGDCAGKASVVISGRNRGLFGAWQGQRAGKMGGNLIHLIEIARGVSHGEAVRYAKQVYLGIQDRPFTAEEKRQWAKAQEANQQAKAIRDREQAAADSSRKTKVRLIWESCQKIAGTPADAYLTRRIGEYSWPASLRYHPELQCEVAKAAGLPARHPCLVAAVQAADRSLVAIWRIFLRPDGTNLVVDGQKVKLGLGPASGGAVRLGPVAPEWNVGEGLESTLGAQALNGFAGSWAATLSTSGMRGLMIPAEVKALRIWTDGDRDRFRSDGALLAPPGQSAGAALAERAGVPCSIHEPPQGSDWNDVWLHGRDNGNEE